MLAVRSVYGSYPSRLLDLWELYDECNGSENDNPAILPVDQQYIVLELANAGQDLESYQFNSAEQAHALFLQVFLFVAIPSTEKGSRTTPANKNQLYFQTILFVNNENGN